LYDLRKILTKSDKIYFNIKVVPILCDLKICFAYDQTGSKRAHHSLNGTIKQQKKNNNNNNKKQQKNLTKTAKRKRQQQQKIIALKHNVDLYNRVIICPISLKSRHQVGN
jgi:hypothetical protein